MDNINDWDEYFMRMAYLVSQKSKDVNTRIGSVLVRDKNIIATGYNSFPRLIKDSLERYNDRDLKRRMTCHSEENTILTSARLGINTFNTTLYTFGLPCSNCSKILIQGGVSEIVIHEQWPNLVHSEEWINSISLSKTMLDEAGIKIRVLDKKLGLIAYLNNKEIYV